MKVMVGLMVMLFRVSHGVEKHCDGRRDGAQCYGPLGGPAVLQLVDNAAEIFRFDWKKNIKRIFLWRNNTILSNQISNRSIFTPSNGTFRINNLSRSDSDNYTLEIFNNDGTCVNKRTLQLFIEAPVSSVLLDKMCLSQGEMRVSCSSERGDRPQYSWTLDGRTLSNAELLSGNNQTNNITLKQHVSGQLVCKVWNNISHALKESTISTCGFVFINCSSLNGTHMWVSEVNNTLCVTDGVTSDTKTTTNANLLLIAGVLAALVILLVAAVAVACSQRKKGRNKPEEEDEQEITYADVRVVQRTGRPIHQKAEMEVVYDHVKVSGRPQRTVKQVEDGCVYSEVRRGM